MIIAVPYKTGEIFQHFGHTTLFKMYTAEGNEVRHSEVIPAPGEGHSAIVSFLAEKHADAVICGGIGSGAREALEEAGIKLYGGVSGNADAAVEELLNGTLVYDPEVRCTHHDSGEHNCGEHSCGGHCH